MCDKKMKKSRNKKEKKVIRRKEKMCVQKKKITEKKKKKPEWRAEIREKKIEGESSKLNKRLKWKKGRLKMKTLSWKKGWNERKEDWSRVQ